MTATVREADIKSWNVRLPPPSTESFRKTLFNSTGALSRFFLWGVKALE